MRTPPPRRFTLSKLRKEVWMFNEVFGWKDQGIHRQTSLFH